MSSGFRHITGQRVGISENPDHTYSWRILAVDGELLATSAVTYKYHADAIVGAKRAMKKLAGVLKSRDPQYHVPKYPSPKR